jgi:signal peptidase II
MIGRLCHYYSTFFFTIIALDQVTKNWALSTCADRPLVLSSFLSCSVTYNRGVAWSLIASDDSRIFFFVSTFVFCLTLFIGYVGYQRYKEGKNAWGECLIVSGSIGNLCDRFFIGSVIDFIELSYNEWYWPVFNGADIAIVVGVSVMFFVNYKEVV